jgi:hypothetical protein
MDYLEGRCEKPIFELLRRSQTIHDPVRSAEKSMHSMLEPEMGETY